MKERLIVFTIIICVLMCASTLYAWTGDSWGPITRDTINSIACEMVDTTWTPLNDIRNTISGVNFYAGSTYNGEAYCMLQPNQDWTEFLNSVNTTVGGNTSYGNDCQGFVSMSWKLPSYYWITTMEGNLGGPYFYALGAYGESPNVSLLPGDALYTQGTSTLGAHIILFDQYNPDGTIQSMEQVPPIARRRTWTWSSLNAFRPVRRDLIEGGFAVNDRVQTSSDAFVRSCPSVSCDPPIWTVPIASQGTIVDGPQNADKFRWWKIQYDDYGTAGWTIEGYLEKISDQNLTCGGDGDLTPPVGSISINSGASYTNYTSVTLNLSCTDSESGCTWMRVSNDNAVWSQWEPYSVTKQWNLASGNGSGSVYVQFKDACDNTSPEYSSSIILQSLFPDFTVSYLSSPGLAVAGSAISITDTTNNSGPGGANASTTSFYLSTTSTLSSAAILLGSRSVPALAAGATSTGSTSVTIQSGTAAGTYYIIAKANSIVAVNDCGYMNPCGGPLLETNNSNNTKYAAISIGPDLIVSSLTAPTTGGGGAIINITDTTKNNGAGDAGASTTSFYFSTTSTLGSGATLLGSRSVPALGAGATGTGTTSVTIPTGLATGTYYIIAKADDANAVAETKENNNTKYVTISIGSDLIVSSVSAPTTVGAGAAINITDTTKNNGAGDAGASTTSFYFSTNTTLDSGDTLLGSRSVPSLGAGLSSTGTTSITIPTGLATGTYYIIAKADDANAVAETNENNNTKYVTISIGSDLIVSSVVAPTTGGGGAAINITDTTKNNGAGDAGASITSFYFSTNTTLDSGDTLLGSRSVPSLGAGLSSTGTTSITIPSGLATGTYYIIAKADDANAVAETNENNNTKYVTISIGSDLIVSSVVAPTTGGAGAAINITDTTKNNGAGDAGASITSFYFSTNTTLDSGDTLLGSRSVPSLGAGSSSTGITTVTIPSGLATGTYYIIAKADDANAVAEKNENNNTKYTTINIGPDLVVYYLSAPTTGGGGAAINITDITKNSGAGDAGTSTTSFYFSTNTTLDSGDTLLGSRSVPALGAGLSSTGTTSVTIPSGLATGKYYIIAKADDANAVVEAKENNNTTYRAITINQ